MSLPCNVFTGLLRPFPAEHPWFSDIQRQVLDDAAHLGLFPEESPHGDFEDFWEDVFRASAAVRACMDTGVPLRLAAEGEVPDTAVRLDLCPSLRKAHTRWTLFWCLTRCVSTVTAS